MAVNLNLFTFNDLPDEAILNVFKCFKRSEIPALAQVCTEWHRIAADHTLWTKEYTVTELLKERPFNLEDLLAEHDPTVKKRDPLVNNGSLAALSEKVDMLKKQVLKAQPLLRIRAKTAHEFDQLYRADKVTRETIDELNEKLKNSEVIEQGFYAACDLCRLDLRPIAFLEDYLKQMEASNYPASRQWLRVADLYIEEKQFAQALQIAETRLQGDYNSFRILYPVVVNYCESHNTKEAFELIKKFKIRNNVDNNSLKQLIYTLHQNKEFGLLETVIAELVSDISKPHEIMELMQAYEKDQKADLARDCFIKNFELLSNCKEFSLYELLPLLISLNLEDQAWKLAEKHFASSPRVYHVLRTTYEDFGNQVMADKAIALIPPEKPAVSPPLICPSPPNDFDDLDIDVITARALASSAAGNNLAVNLSDGSDTSDDDAFNELLNN